MVKSPCPSSARGSTVSMPCHQSGKRDGSYSSFQTSSTGAALRARSSNAGTGTLLTLHRDVAQLALDALELTGGLDRGERRAPEVDEAGRELAAVRPHGAAPPRGRGLAQPSLGERLVPAPAGDEALHVGEAGDEDGGTVAGADGLERHRAKLRLRVVAAAEPGERFRDRKARERAVHR